jgi:site-specific recombinase XerD
MRYVEYKVPSALDQTRGVLAIPVKKHDSRLVSHLSIKEMKALLEAPDATTRAGIRDRAMLHVGFVAGLRVSELVGLQFQDVSLQSAPSVRIRGKGRKERILPLCKESTRPPRAWLAVRADALVPELFLNARDQNMSRSGFEYVLRKHLRTAASKTPSLLKKRVSPHVLRHTCAMNILKATGDLRKVALWLGHASMQTTEVYTRVDPTEKLEVIDATPSLSIRRGKFPVTDKLIDSLKPSNKMRCT